MGVVALGEESDGQAARLPEQRQRLSEQSAQIVARLPEQSAQIVADAVLAVQEAVQVSLAELQASLNEQKVLFEEQRKSWARISLAINQQVPDDDPAAGLAGDRTPQDQSLSIQPDGSQKATASNMGALDSLSSALHQINVKDKIPRMPSSFVDKFGYSEGMTVVAAGSTVSHKLRFIAQKLVYSTYFSYGMCMIIMMNAVTIGWEINLDLIGQKSAILSVTDHIFLFIYLSELALAVYAKGADAWRGTGGGWFKFDALLVMIGVSTSWLLVPIMEGSQGSNTDSTSISFLKQILIFRLLRILKLARALRLVAYFESLGKLVAGMLSSAQTMVSALALIILVVYILACLAAELIAKSETLREDPVVREIIDEKFSTLPLIIMTLMQFATVDSVSAIYYPICVVEPVLAGFFLLCFTVISVLLMNLVAAIVLEDALSRANRDREQEAFKMRQKIKKLRPFIEKIFDDLDKSRDGEIQLAEVSLGLSTMKIKLPQELEDVMQIDLLEELFECLDLDGSGNLSRSEFTNGVAQLALTSVPIETTRMLELLRSQRCMVMGVQAECRLMKRAWQVLLQRMHLSCPWPTNQSDHDRVARTATTNGETGENIVAMPSSL